MLNIVCVRVGDKYGPEYVAILQDMVARNLDVEHRFWCVTDAPETLPEGVGAIASDPAFPGWWAKIQLFAPHMPWAPGERVVYFDLDVCITGRLEALVATPGIIRDWNLPGFNSSVMVWNHGERLGIWPAYRQWRAEQKPDSMFAPGLIGIQNFHGDQDLITWADANWRPCASTKWQTFPRDWCVSYRAHAQEWPPEGSVVVVFHGKPDPHECSGWVANVWKIGGMGAFPKLDGMNVGFDVALGNMAQNSKRDLPWFTGFSRRDETVCIVGGAPSMKDSLPAIRALKAKGVRIVSLNNALAYLVDHAITPDVHVMVDARPEMVGFVANAPRSTRYFIASQCDPSVFDALKKRQVTVWHAAVCDECRDVLAPYDKLKPICLVGGGGTVGLRALNLCWLSGYKTLHVFGMDSSFADTHHAYPQPLNDGDRTVQVTMGDKTYRCALWMVRQANEFKESWAHLAGEGVTIHVHGSGLIPDMARVLELQEAA